MLDKFFELEEPFDSAQAYCDKAAAFLTMGNIDASIKSYKSALEQENKCKGVKTDAYIELPMLFAEHNLREHYQEGVKILQDNIDRLTFPVDRFRWHAAMAIFIHSDLNNCA